MGVNTRKIEGIIEDVKVFSGWARDFRVRIGDNDYYMRIHSKEKRDLLEKASNNFGKRVVLEYQESKTRLNDWLADRILFASFGIPIKYKEINRMLVINSANSTDNEYNLHEDLSRLTS